MALGGAARGTREGDCTLSNYTQRWVPKRRPKNPSSGKKKTYLGMRREGPLDALIEHATEEHGWGEQRGMCFTNLRDCPTCAEYYKEIKESEEWV